MGNLLTVPECSETTFAFTNINQQNLDMATPLAKRDIEGNNLSAKVFSTANRREALTDADNVI